VAGETAPLLFTAFGNLHFSTDLNQPISTLPHILYTYAISPYDDWRQLAWGAAVVLALLVLITSTAARIAGRNRYGDGR
jgi:phosphate transport system permease protein